MMKINKLEIENVKRVKAVKIEPSENGLTIIGGRNNQGKTSVLDSIAWALGGDRYRPSQAVREGSVIPPHLHIVMSNGLEVERKGKNSDLKVTDPTGKRAGQQLLNEFVEELAIDLPKFMEASSREKAEEDANAHRAEYDTMTAKLNDVRQKKIDLLKNASLPLPGLSVENGELTYNGHRWDSMSGSEQLKVSTAIVRKLNPNCGFVLIDKLEQMDTETLQDFGTWLEQEGLQAIATRVSTGGECSIIIEDGYVKGEVPQKKEWKAGEF